MDRLYVREHIESTLEKTVTNIENAGMTVNDRKWTIFSLKMSVEQAIWNEAHKDTHYRKTVDDRKVYAALYNMVIGYLGKNDVIESLITNQIDAVDLVKLSPFDVWVKEEKEWTITRQNQKLDKKTSKEYKCRKCGYNETTFTEFQARGSDEANVIAAQCVRCGNIWRLS